ncbi:MAG: hypothetical protein P4M04_08110 [Acidobacteriota bacterium]|nr:hypothetical protein [Acidobacteriota bacterium]
MPATAQPQSENFLVYMNLEHGIWMKYPSSWDKQEDLGANAFGVYFASPQEDPFDQFRENLNVIVEPLPQPMTLEQVVAANRQNLLEGLQVTFVENAMPDKIGGLPAYRTVYTGAMMGRSLKWLQYYAVKGDRAYYVTYTAEPNKFDKFLGTIQQMVASLEIQ